MVQWLDKQLDDCFCRRIVEKTELTIRICLNENEENVDCFFREGEGEILGRVKRHYVERHGYSSQATAANYERDRKQMIVSMVLVQRCLYYYNDGGMSHAWRSKTLAAAQMKYYWRAMRDQCNTRAKASVEKHKRSVRSFYRMRMGVAKSIIGTERGNKHRLVFKWTLTKWVKILVLSAQNAAEDVECLIEVLMIMVQILSLPTHTNMTAYNPKSEGLTEYVENLVKMMAHTGERVRLLVVMNVDIYNRIPQESLEFKSYEAGEHFMLKRQPERLDMDEKSRERMKLVTKFENRWVGAYWITKQLSQRLYDADIHERTGRDHAVNIKIKDGELA